MNFSVSDEGAITSSTMDNQIVSATAVNYTTVSLTFAEKIKNCLVDMSLNGVHWENAVCKDNKISGLQPGKKYYFRLKNTASNKVEVTMPSANQITSSSCTYKGKTYKIGKSLFKLVKWFVQTDWRQTNQCLLYPSDSTYGGFFSDYHYSAS